MLIKQLIQSIQSDLEARTSSLVINIVPSAKRMLIIPFRSLPVNLPVCGHYHLIDNKRLIGFCLLIIADLWFRCLVSMFYELVIINKDYDV